MRRRPISRRVLIGAGGAAAAAGGVGVATTRRRSSRKRIVATAVPMQAVRLLPSRFHDAMTTNAAYLMSLDPKRLLHNYYVQAGLPPQGAVYGGWESDTIAGHTLGHLLSALSLLHAQTGDPAPRDRVAFVVGELALCQAHAPDHYLGGFTRTRDGHTEPGRLIFEEVRRGDIGSSGFDLNGGWSPLYNWHKLMAGLLDADLYCATPDALAVCTRLAAWIAGVFDALDDRQVQQVLACEYGGLNESFAELSVRTGERRWLVLARRIRDNRTLDLLARGRDDLANLHANTQIPKIIGLARIAELDGDADDVRASATFWNAVVRHHSYVIGGNGDREYFAAPDTTGAHVTEQTCETCASYNMLKLTRHLYARDPDAAYFEYYERTQLNHILAQQNPRTGMFAYMTPVMSGARRDFSTPFDDFWCCVGTGMESHAKHGDSVWWYTGRDTLILNLFVPSAVTWSGLSLTLASDVPDGGHATLRVDAATRTAPLALRVRIPAWSQRTAARLNGAAIAADRDGQGYLTVTRAWQAGDTLALDLDMALRLERPPGDTRLVSVFRGPAALAADLGPADAPFDGVAPAFVGDDPLARLHALPAAPSDDASPLVATAGLVRPADLVLTPFAALHDRRAALYFPVFTEAEWIVEKARFRAAEEARAALAARAVDTLHPGEMQSERDHALASALSYPLVYRGRNGRDLRAGGFVAFDLRTRPGALVLLVTFWGDERDRAMRILVDGTEIARTALDGTPGQTFFDKSFPIPPDLTVNREKIAVRIEPTGRRAAGTMFGIMLLGAAGEEHI